MYFLNKPWVLAAWGRDLSLHLPAYPHCPFPIYIQLSPRGNATVSSATQIFYNDFPFCQFSLQKGRIQLSVYTFP